MKSLLILLAIITLYPPTALTQENYYSKKNIDYTYQSLYIDSTGDTLINGLLVIRTLGRTWLGQPGLQKAIRYHYITDQKEYNEYCETAPDFINEKKFARKRNLKQDEYTLTGGIQTKEEFYMHPPRNNQCEILFYSAHPRVELSCLTDSSDFYTRRLIIPMTAHFNLIYTARFNGSKTLFGYKNMKTWEIICPTRMINEGKFKIKERHSLFTGTFCYELGFTKMHYEYENGIKILFDLIRVSTLNEIKP